MGEVPDVAAFYFRFTMLRPDNSVIPIDPGEKFTYPENSTTEYRVKAIYWGNAVVERLSDGHVFKITAKPNP